MMVVVVVAMINHKCAYVMFGIMCVLESASSCVLACAQMKITIIIAPEMYV